AWSAPWTATTGRAPWGARSWREQVVGGRHRGSAEARGVDRARFVGDSSGAAAAPGLADRRRRRRPSLQRARQDGAHPRAGAGALRGRDAALARGQPTTNVFAEVAISF